MVNDDEVQKDFRKRLNELHQSYKRDADQGMSGIGGYTAGKCTDWAIGMACANKGRCDCTNYLAKYLMKLGYSPDTEVFYVMLQELKKEE